jgi:hypothetical protein
MTVETTTTYHPQSTTFMANVDVIRPPQKTIFITVDVKKHVEQWFWLTSIQSSEYKLVKWILLSIVADSGSYIVRESLFNLYGIGDNEKEAINDYASMLVELFEDLTRSEKILSKQLHIQLNKLRQYIVPC